MSKLTMIFDAQIAKAVAKMKQLGKSVKSAFSGMKGAVAGIGAAAGFAMSIGAVKDKINELDNLSKNARGLNMTGEQLQILGYACRSANVDFEQLKNSIPKIAKLTMDAANGSSEAADKLARLGLSVKDLQGKSGYDQLMLVAQALNEIPDPTARSAAAMDVFGKSAGKMLDMLSGISKAGDEARAQGVIIDDAQLQAAEKFDQALTNIHDNIVAGLVNSGLVEWLAKVAEGFNKGMQGIKNFATEIFSLFQNQPDNSKPISDLEVKMANEQQKNRLEKEKRQAAEAEEKKRQREEARKQAADKAKQAEEQKKKDRDNKELEAFNKQLKDLQGRNNGPKTRQQYIDEEVDKAKKAAPDVLDQSRIDQIVQAAGAAYDRQEADKQDSKTRDTLLDQLHAAGQTANEYSGDAVRRIGGTLGGARGAERMQQSQLRIAQQQLVTTANLLQTLQNLKIKNPHIFS